MILKTFSGSIRNVNIEDANNPPAFFITRNRSSSSNTLAIQFTENTTTDVDDEGNEITIPDPQPPVQSGNSWIIDKNWTGTQYDLGSYTVTVTSNGMMTINAKEDWQDGDTYTFEDGRDEIPAQTVYIRGAEAASTDTEYPATAKATINLDNLNTTDLDACNNFIDSMVNHKISW